MVKEKVGKLEEEARGVFTRQFMKELNGVMGGVVFRKGFLVGFQDILEK